MVRTVPISKEVLDLNKGVLLVDPDGYDKEEMDQVFDALIQAQFLTSVCYVEGYYSPVLETNQREACRIRSNKGVFAGTRPAVGL